MTVAASCAKIICRTGLVITALMLSACSILPKQETLIVYQLPATPLARQTDAITPRAPSRSLRVATPYSSQVIDSQRILVVPQGSQVSAYSGVRWSDPAPILVRNRLVSAFRSDGRLTSVSIDSSGANADFELGGDLVEFQVVYQDDAPVVHIHYDASVTRSDGNRTIATRRFEVAEPVQGKEAPEVVEAFGRAADRLAAEIVTWTLQYTTRTK
ncbi:membrane integrity-associated transporter subunit PqiC [Alcaligenaceae bacterium]|nr:membrane integrity-associated transporter subunit PqiC [Alcaligenaceae bacterium]